MDELTPTPVSASPASEPVVAELAVSKKSSLAAVEKLFLPLAIIIAGAMISGTIFYTRGANGGPPSGGTPNANAPVAVSVDDDPVIGNANAKVTVIEFSDFQCPFCRKFWEDTFHQLKKDYIDTGKIKFVYRDFPLPFHPAAQPSAEAAECAHEQGKFWEYHDKMFTEEAKQGDGTVVYGVKELKLWAKQIGLNEATFNQCVDSHKYKAEVEKDSADGTLAGVNGTPSFFVNGQLLVGAQPFVAFKAAIDAALEKK